MGGPDRTEWVVHTGQGGRPIQWTVHLTEEYGQPLGKLGHLIWSDWNTQIVSWASQCDTWVVLVVIEVIPLVTTGNLIDNWVSQYIIMGSPLTNIGWSITLDG